MNNALARLRARLQAQFALTETPILLPFTRTTYRITLPEAVDPLLDAAEDDPEQHLPYWATIWPSGVALGDVVLAERERFAGQRTLELGCGIGVTAAAALAADAELIVTDYSPASLLLCRLNCLVNARREPRTLQLNWREPRPELFHWARTPFPHVLAADLLYETRDVAPLLDLVEPLVAAGGTLWLAEPRRPTAQLFLEAIRERGWVDEATQHEGWWHEPADRGVVVNVHRLRRSRDL